MIFRGSLAGPLAAVVVVTMVTLAWPSAREPRNTLQVIDARLHPGRPVARALRELGVDTALATRMVLATAGPERWRVSPDGIREALGDASDTAVFVQPQPPCAESMRRLRLDVEGQFEGAARGSALRRTVAVRSMRRLREPGDCRRWLDALVCAGDNFGGLGARVNESGRWQPTRCATGVPP